MVGYRFDCQGSQRSDATNRVECELFASIRFFAEFDVNRHSQPAKKQDKKKSGYVEVNHIVLFRFCGPLPGRPIRVVVVFSGKWCEFDTSDPPVFLRTA